MHSFKRAITGTLAFVLCCAVISAAIMAPAFFPDSLYNDSRVRAELSGSVDTLICGASHGLSAFVPKAIDEEAGTSSYNASSYLISFAGRKKIIEKELERNPVSTVVLEIAYDSIRDTTKNSATGEPMILCKLDSAAERLSYFKENVHLNDGGYDTVYAMLLRYGLNAWKAKIKGNVNIPRENKGNVPVHARNIEMSDRELRSMQAQDPLGVEFDPVGLAYMREIAQLCTEHGAELIIAVTPLSERTLWSHYGWDEFHDVLTSFCAENGCILLDFNLHRERSTALSDRDCFSDPTHMGEPGSTAFSRIFGQTLKAIREGENVEDRFYSSYEEAISHMDCANR